MKSRAILVSVTALLLGGEVDAQHEHGPGPIRANTFERELADVRAATARYRDHAAALTDGYVRFGSDGPLMGEHWYRRDLVRAPLELTRPSTLQYAYIGGRRQLVGVAYTVFRAPADPLPEGFTGSADAWHVHDVDRLGTMLTEDRPVLRMLMERARRRRSAGEAERPHLTMLHAWVWLDNPAGVFAQEHLALPYLRAGLPADWAGGAAAARGAALLTEGACSAEVRRIDVLARLAGTQRRTIAAACSAAAAGVSAAPRAAGADAFNAAAAEAWRTFERSRDAALTTEQRGRLAAVIEHEHPAVHRSR